MKKKPFFTEAVPELIPNHLPELHLVDYTNSERLPFLQFAAGFFSSEQVTGFFAHAIGDFAAFTDDQLGNLFARLTQCAGNDPRRSFDLRISRHIVSLLLFAR